MSPAWRVDPDEVVRVGIRDARLGELRCRLRVAQGQAEPEGRPQLEVPRAARAIVEGLLPGFARKRELVRDVVAGAGHGRLEEHRWLIVTDIPVTEAVVRIGTQGSVALADRFVLERWLQGEAALVVAIVEPTSRTAADAMRNGLNPFTEGPFGGDARDTTSARTRPRGRPRIASTRGSRQNDPEARGTSATVGSNRIDRAGPPPLQVDGVGPMAASVRGRRRAVTGLSDRGPAGSTLRELSGPSGDRRHAAYMVRPRTAQQRLSVLRQHRLGQEQQRRSVVQARVRR